MLNTIPPVCLRRPLGGSCRVSLALGGRELDLGDEVVGDFDDSALEVEDELDRVALHDRADDGAPAKRKTSGRLVRQLIEREGEREPNHRERGGGRTKKIHLRVSFYTRIIESSVA